MSHLKGRLRNGLERENVDGSAVACPPSRQLASHNYNFKNILTGTDNDTEHQNFWTLLLELYSAFSKLILTLSQFYYYSFNIDKRCNTIMHLFKQIKNTSKRFNRIIQPNTKFTDVSD